MRFLVLPLLIATLGAPLAAQDAPDAACANVRIALPPELAGWSDQSEVVAGVQPGQGGTVTIGKAASVSLHPARHLSLSPAPSKTSPPDSNGGTLAFSIAEEGSYRIALSEAAWIDVVRDGKAIDSTAHTHGPKCSGVRKMVDFKLTPGTYAIQLSGSATPTLALMVAKL